MSNMKQTCRIFVPMRNPFPHLHQMWWHTWWMMTPGGKALCCAIILSAA